MYRPLMLLLLSSAFVSIPSTSISQEACDAPYIASDVGLSTGSNLPEDVAAATRAALIGRCFDSPTDAELVASIQRVLHDMGYLRATVSAPSMTLVNMSRYPQRASLSFTVHEGPRAQVQEIEVAGNNLIDADRIRSVIQVPLGESLDMSRVRESSRSIQRLYRANGFSKMTFKQMIEFSTERKVRVIFQINEGPRS
ncbi:MAG TPA: POTRA domain-containing protein [Candidatus Eisenbacteria bacterium]|nr:POTRA domain-containing protein [Candidatus Eisenbacteria bacterium]